MTSRLLGEQNYPLGQCQITYKRLHKRSSLLTFRLCDVCAQLAVDRSRIGYQSLIAIFLE